MIYDTVSRYICSQWVIIRHKGSLRERDNVHQTKQKKCKSPNATKIYQIQSSGVKTVFLNKTGNRFVETGYLPVIGLRDVMGKMTASPGKEGGWPIEMQLHNRYIDDSLHEVTRRV